MLAMEKAKYVFVEKPVALTVEEGKAMHATSCDHLPNATLVGVCDIKKDRADKAAKKYGVQAYYDYKELIDKEKIDVVHICVPHYLHPIISKYALEQGVNVLCEKPMSIKYEDALENVALAEKMGLKYGSIFQCRFNDTSKLIKENIVNGKLGKVLSARVVLTWCKPDEYYSLSDWKGTPDTKLWKWTTRVKDLSVTKTARRFRFGQ